MTNATHEGELRRVKMAHKVSFKNNGKSTTTEEYTATKSLKQIIEIMRVKAMTSMKSLAVSDTVRMRDEVSR